MIRHQRRYLADHQAIPLKLSSDERWSLERFIARTGEKLEDLVMGTVGEGMDLAEMSFKEGREKGREEGYVDGYQKGSEDGRGRGYEKGYERGHRKGEKVGDDRGYRSGYDKGREDGRIYYRCERCGDVLEIQPDSVILEEMTDFLNRKRWKHLSSGECRKRR
jgi:hypothetical protein